MPLRWICPVRAVRGGAALCWRWRLLLPPLAPGTLGRYAPATGVAASLPAGSVRRSSAALCAA
eukprot:3297455-Lingulodinium_polyedra.AAC.1